MLAVVTVTAIMVVVVLVMVIVILARRLHRTKGNSNLTVRASVYALYVGGMKQVKSHVIWLKKRLKTR